MLIEGKNSFGFLTMAFGSARYLEQAKNLALSLRLHMPGVPIAVITDRKGPLSPFDEVVQLDSSRGGGVSQKIFIDKYSIFLKTCFIDSDCIVTRSFWNEFKELSRYSFSPVCESFLTVGDSDNLITDLQYTLKSLRINRFPKFNGGLYYFKQDELSRRVFEFAREILARWYDLGLKPFDNFGPADETVFGLAMEMAGACPFDDRGRLMRTPLQIIGRLEIDPLGGGTRFNKGGKVVEPAICHFCGDYANYLEYKWCESILRGNSWRTFAILCRQRLGRIFHRLPRGLRKWLGSIRDGLNSLRRGLNFRKPG